MQKTTVYLPEELKERIALAARREGRSEAAVIRAALDRYTGARRPPSIGIVASGDPLLADRVDEVLARGFGRD